MEFFEEELFHDKRQNLNVHQKFPLDFIRTEFWWHLLNGTLIRYEKERDRLRKASVILLAVIHDGIYWMKAHPL
jgi:hypothetical protein